jgi:hypothetical protein
VPDWILDPEILRRIEAEGSIERIRVAQMAVLGSLMSEARLNRLIEYESLAEEGHDVYSLAELSQDLRAGLWTELEGGGRVSVDVYRRNLQRGYLDLVDARLNPPAPAEGETPARVLSDVRPVLRGDLRWLRERLASALPRAADEITRLHIADLQEEVERIFEGA